MLIYLIYLIYRLAMNGNFAALVPVRHTEPCLQLGRKALLVPDPDMHTLRPSCLAMTMQLTCKLTQMLKFLLCVQEDSGKLVLACLY